MGWNPFEDSWGLGTGGINAIQENPLAIVNPGVYFGGATTGAAAGVDPHVAGNAAVIGGGALGLYGLGAIGAAGSAAGAAGTSGLGAGSLAAGAGFSWPGAIQIGGSLLGSYLGYDAARSAARAEQQGAEAALGLQRDMFETTRADFAPWRIRGVQALDGLAEAYGLSGDAPNFDLFRSSPGYEFARDERIRSLDRSAASRGGLFSGGHSRDLVRYAGGLADQTFGDYTNRLAALAGLGQTATGSTANAGQNYATNAGNLNVAMGDARASGYLNQAYALGHGIDQLSRYAGGQNG